MLWVLERAVSRSLRQFLRAPKTNVKTDGRENIYNLPLKTGPMNKMQLKVHVYHSFVRLIE